MDFLRVRPFLVIKFTHLSKGCWFKSGYTVHEQPQIHLLGCWFESQPQRVLVSIRMLSTYAYWSTSKGVGSHPPSTSKGVGSNQAVLPLYPVSVTNTYPAFTYPKVDFTFLKSFVITSAWCGMVWLCMSGVKVVCLFVVVFYTHSHTHAVSMFNTLQFCTIGFQTTPHYLHPIASSPNIHTIRWHNNNSPGYF